MTKYICIQRISNYKVGEIVEATIPNLNEIARILNMNNAHCTYWVQLDESKIAYFDIEGEEPIQRLKERLQNNMVPVTGFDYPFSISRCKLSQEDYAVIMGVDHFYHEEAPVGADCPYLTNEWDQYICRYSSGQNRGEIDEILKKLEKLTDRQFRLPTIKEAEFINQLKSKELGFKLENELCEAGGSRYLCTEEGRIYVSDPMYVDLPPYQSIRLVECERPLGQINYQDDDVVRAIQRSMSDYEEDMHYYWEN
jgi:hypothetical protein